jgi:hypothetical protein
MLIMWVENLCQLRFLYDELFDKTFLCRMKHPLLTKKKLKPEGGVQANKSLFRHKITRQREW